MLALPHMHAGFAPSQFLLVPLRSLSNPTALTRSIATFLQLPLEATRTVAPGCQQPKNTHKRLFYGSDRMAAKDFMAHAQNRTVGLRLEAFFVQHSLYLLSMIDEHQIPVAAVDGKTSVAHELGVGN